MRDKLISQGVKNLNEFGYTSCTSENIMTDQLYAEFFRGMLKDNKGHSEEIDKEIDSLISDLPKN